MRTVYEFICGKLIRTSHVDSFVAGGMIDAFTSEDYSVVDDGSRYGLIALRKGSCMLIVR